MAGRENQGDCMDARDRLRSRVSLGLDALACWSGTAGRMAGSRPHDHLPAATGHARRHAYPWSPAGRAGRRTAGPARPASAATATLPPPPGTSLGAAVNGPDGSRTPGFANAATLPHPSPSTAPVRLGLVPQCGQEPGTWGDTPRPVALSHSGRRRAVLTSRWPWASDGPSAERRIVGPCRHWRSRGTLSGGGPSRRLPLTDRRRRRTTSGPGGSAARPVCAPSAGLAQ